ncbi:hypothetical protein O6H91_08G051400 [Diphasiastrum complanatum]|uniref:Uncharacterized protein n=1 Tax=Diphasiastrum complanatum TaxID=34168 RepID=A0ACC2CYG3_DIPCM|nr:hypothetical protein O6H91_08G051400 [Diphasiastrum complanatum]
MQTQVHKVGEGADQLQERSADPESYNLTTGKQDYISSIEPSTPEHEQSEHTGKKSMMGKMKDKANRLKSKIKSSYATKKSGDIGSDDADEEDEDDSTSSPERNSEPSADDLVPNSPPRQPVGTEPTLTADEDDQIHENNDYANALDEFGTHSVLKDRPFELKEDVAAPTPGSKEMELDYNNDPRAASDKPPSYSETLERQQNEPAAPEQESAGIAEGLQFKESNHGEDRVSSNDEYGKSQGEFTPAGRGENYSDSLTGFTERSDKEGLSPRDKEESSSRDDAYVHNPSWTDKGTGIVSAAKSALGFLPGGKEGNPADYFLSGSSQRSDRGDTLNEETSPVSQDGESEFGYDSKNNIGSNFSSLQSNEDKLADPTPVTDRAADGLSAAKDTLVGTSLASVGAVKSTLGYPSDESDMKSNTELGESIDKSENSDKPRSWGEWASGSVNSAKDAIVTKLGVSPTSVSDASVDRSTTTQTTPENRSWTESVKSIIMPTGGNPELAEHNRSSNTSGPLSSSSTPEDTVASKPVYSEQKGVTQKIIDSAASVKDTLASKIGYASPNEEPTLDKGENVARNLDSPISGGDVSAKDSTISLFQPGEDDQALSEKITQLLSPSHIKDSIVAGFSSKTTETPEDTSAAPVKGVLSRVTDAVSSLLGSKSPTNEDSQQQMYDKENSAGEQIGTNVSKSHVSEQDIIN